MFCDIQEKLGKNRKIKKLRTHAAKAYSKL